MIRSYFLLLLLLLGTSRLLSQKYLPFEGKITYEVVYSDSMTGASPLTSFMTVYTNDTMVRIETETVQLGKQITIKHLQLHKYYILLDINGQKFAIQHHETTDSLKTARYTFKRMHGRKKFDGHKAKAIQVKSVNGNFTQKVWYFKDLNPIYTEAIQGIPGLPAEYEIKTEDGIYHYKVVEFRQEGVKKDAFGVPKDYKRVTFDEFMEQMMNAN